MSTILNHSRPESPCPDVTLSETFHLIGPGKDGKSFGELEKLIAKAWVGRALEFIKRDGTSAGFEPRQGRPEELREFLTAPVPRVEEGADHGSVQVDVKLRGHAPGRTTFRVRCTAR